MTEATASAVFIVTDQLLTETADVMRFHTIMPQSLQPSSAGNLLHRKC